MKGGGDYVSALPAGFPPRKLAKKEGEVLTRPGGLGGQEVKGCSYKALLEAVSPSASELDQMFGFLQRHGGQAVRLPQGADFGARLSSGCDNHSHLSLRLFFSLSLSYSLRKCPAGQKMSGFIALSEPAHYVQKDLAPDRRGDSDPTHNPGKSILKGKKFPRSLYASPGRSRRGQSLGSSEGRKFHLTIPIPAPHFCI